MDPIRKWVEDFLRDPIGNALETGLKVLEVAVGIMILMFFFGLARSCVGL